MKTDPNMPPPKDDKKGMNDAKGMNDTKGMNDAKGSPMGGTSGE